MLKRAPADLGEPVADRRSWSKKRSHGRAADNTLDSDHRREPQRPIAMFVDRSDQAAIEAAVEAGVSAYVVDGLKRERVKPILDMAISRFNAFSRTARELQEARSELENRKLIDRAKGILMSTRGPSEADAYALLRNTAMNQNRKISEIAESLITASGLLGPPEDK